MKYFNIYKNYGVLAAEKRAVYTVGGPSSTAKCYDRLTVETPEGWDVWERESGELCATSPGGVVYAVRDILCGDESPAFSVWTPETSSRFYTLRVCSVEEH